VIVRDKGIATDADLGPLLESPPATTPEVLKQLRYMYDAGGWVLVESAIADLPIDLRWLLESEAVDINGLGRLHEALGIVTAGDVGAAIARRAIAEIGGFDESVESAVARALPRLRASLPRIPLGRAIALAQPIISRLQELPQVAAVTPVGSVRRGLDFVGDIELVAVTDAAEPAIDTFVGLLDHSRILHRSDSRAYLLTDRVQLGLRCVEPSSAGAALLHLTGSVAHLTALRAVANERGGSLEPDGLVCPEGERVAVSEEAIYNRLGMPFIPPEIRTGSDEIDAARSGRLPALVTRDDIRGDLHMHTEWSDGRDTIEAMVQAAMALGYEYMAITDHSPSSAATRNLTADAVSRQADEIARLRERYPLISILHGCEVDILQDGHLDFPTRILERFDIVLASLHEAMGHSPERLMRRYQAAMRHPLVTIITHPTNRVVPHRKGYDLDYDRLFALAAETGTVVEVDGSPSHLDLHGTLARKAVAAGATIAIDSDCHRAEMLDRQMQLGLMLARSGWVERRHVLNARPLAEVRALIAAKRGA
jgi:DNA polymerase (family 10)